VYLLRAWQASTWSPGGGPNGTAQDPRPNTAMVGGAALHALELLSGDLDGASPGALLTWVRVEYSDDFQRWEEYALYTPPDDVAGWPGDWRQRLAQYLSATVNTVVTHDANRQHGATVELWDGETPALWYWYPDGPAAKLSPENGRASVYALRKLPEMRARWNGAAGAAVRDMAHATFPLYPSPALLCKTANSVNYRERYCGTSFCAIGLFQTPEATWTRLRTDARVRVLLGGRDAVATEPLGNDGLYPWQAASAIPDQCAVGLVDVRKGFEGLLRVAPRGLLTDSGSQWAWCCAVMAYTVGPGGAALVLQRYADQLAAAPEPSRFGALLLAVARDAAVPREPIGHAVARTWQQLECARMLADSINEPSPWYLPDLGGADLGAVQLAVSSAYYARPAPLGPASAGGVSSARGSGSGLLWGLAIVGVVVLGGVVWYQLANGKRVRASSARRGRRRSA
jgi:hypothetical protein